MSYLAAQRVVHLNRHPNPHLPPQCGQAWASKLLHPSLALRLDVQEEPTDDLPERTFQDACNTPCRAGSLRQR